MLRGYLYIVLAAVLWGIIGPVSKLAFSQGLEPMEVAFWRAMLAWICFGGHALLKKEVRIHPRDIPALLLFAVSGVTLFYGSYQLAIEKGGAALAAVLLYTAPAWVTLLSRLIFKETMTPIKLLALFMTLAGVVGVSLGGGDWRSDWEAGLSAGAILAGLTAGFCYSLYYIFGKYFSGRYSSPNIFLYMLPIGALGLLPWVHFSPKSPAAWVALVSLAFFSTYLAYYLYYIGLKRLEASRAAITATLEPVVAAAIAYIWWQEYFSVIGYVGGSLILGAVLVIIWDEIRPRRVK